ncbi:RsmB/NOP family class I SAM-dependent RNA methyltransferase [Sphingomonas immobilis]|uniref:RsmB/NOP family class I SAM-dependent RNA methyltransferase n=1 Tax=Sphingomonas immobilis TaxID=3063997 RepID=A0ABT9A0H2_9SPHN|nr:RsmB/NOP family class I SAM-dependent RNA methyltransferase [Sphingomonas sp. CA1-15]MDO7842750.1 RsmB/NOP family class I SAM-dependent RNA methyltransferase [Sphingomonas sp. CA1-15]
MTPASRAQAAIELLDQIIAAAREGGAAADTLIARYFAARRYAGSKDRRAVRELVYAAIREHGELPPSGRAAIAGLASYVDAFADADWRKELPWFSADLFDGSAHGPAPLSANEVWRPGQLGGWAMSQVLAAVDHDDREATALLERAPLDIRINRQVAGSVEISGGEAIAGLPDALRLPSGTNVEGLDLWKAGGLEVQDAGSQIVTQAARAQPGQRIVDLCAGAGGKTLALAAAMENRGALLATDSDRARLSRLAPRAERAGVSIVETRLLDPNREAEALADWQAQADAVLIDAPCSGTGTWRRNPEARWRLTPARLAKLVETQARLLEIGAGLVRPGGALVYIVCSLLDDEGAGQVARFLGDHPDWSAEPLSLPAGTPHGAGLRLTPLRDDTDGFFVARLSAPC